MKKLNEALKSHLQELEKFYFGGPQSTETAAQLSNTELDKLISAYENDAALPVPHARPAAHRSRNQRTFQSFQAFFFVAGELRTFRQRQGLPRAPIKVRNSFIEFAQRMYPHADYDIVVDHLRIRQRLLPHYDEPTCFLLVRHEFDDGSVGDVVIAGPANGRL